MPNMERWYPVGVTLFMVKKRTKVLIGVAAGVVVLLLLAGALFWRPTPYEFMRGARFEGVWIRSQRLIMVSSSGVVRPPSSIASSTLRKYWLPQSLSDVEVIATRELKADGWDQPIQTANRLKDTFYMKDNEGSIQIMSHDGGSLVIISSETAWVDRLQSWLWKRKYSQAEGQLAR